MRLNIWVFFASAEENEKRKERKKEKKIYDKYLTF